MGALLYRSSVLPMSLQFAKVWEFTAGAAVIVGAAGIGAWLLFRRRPTAEELEVGRRLFLTQSGRLVDGTLLEVCEVPADDGRILTMLLYGYRIGGVDIQCSQDVTNMRAVVDPELVRAGFPCSVRYQPGNPQNSIVIAEKWSGLRTRNPAPNSPPVEIDDPVPAAEDIQSLGSEADGNDPAGPPHAADSQHVS